MEAEEILRDIFGATYTTTDSDNQWKSGNAKKSKLSDDSKINHYLNWVKNFIEAAIEKNISPQNEVDNRPGRIGPNIVTFFASPDSRQFIISQDKLSLYSIYHFCTIKANTAVDQGKWMYELQLGSKGLMQVGWSTAQCKFHAGCGVGDTVNSYSYDGSNVRKWNMNTQKYGEPWLAGDIIGCAIDLDNGTVDFYRNGRHLGKAFENISTGSGISYFPTVSLAAAESLTANFGSAPLRYAVEGYQILEVPPVEELAQASLLLKWFQKIVELPNETRNSTDRRSFSFNKPMNSQEFLTSITKSILKYLGPLIVIPYVTQEIFIPFLYELCDDNSVEQEINSSEAKRGNVKLSTCLDLLWSLLEEQELKKCLENTMHWLLSTFRHLSLTLEYSDQRRTLELLTIICQHTLTRKYMLEYVLFNEGRFAHFMYIKVLDEGNLAEVVPDVWWKTEPVDPQVEQNKESYFRACKQIEDAVSEVEALQVKLVLTLLNTKDGNDKQTASRTIFVKNFKRFIHENFLPCDLSPKILVPLPITLGCFQRVLVVIQDLWDTEIEPAFTCIPTRAFYDGSISYHGIDRLGGVLSHLQKTYKAELTNRLGPDHRIIRNLEEEQQTTDQAETSGTPAGTPDSEPRVTRIFGAFRQPNLSIFERLRSFSRSGRKSLMKQGKPPDSIDPLIDLLDCTILFYHVAAKKQLAKAASFEEDMLEYIAAVSDASEWFDGINDSIDSESHMIRDELLRTINAFKANISKLARYTAWAKAAILSMQKQMKSAWLVKIMVLTLQNASQEGNLFRFVPVFYLEALVDLWISLRNNVDPDDGIKNIPQYEEMFSNVAEFVCEHFQDSRIVHEDAKDSVILMIAGFVSNPFTLKILENVPLESRMKFTRNMLKPYERVAWPQSNWVINKFWQGHGFAYRYKRSPHLAKKLGSKVVLQKSNSKYMKPCPSLVYQEHIKDVLLSNPQATVKFLDSFLNKLNWTFSEFIGWIQEIYSISLRTGIFIDRGQMKTCATCFDLTVLLLRVLEMICTIAPSTFSISMQTSNRDLLLRLNQLLCHILNRVGSHTNCFQHVVLLQIPELLPVDHYPILTAVIGILLALLKEEMHSFSRNSTEVPPVTRILLTEPSFQISSLHFVLGNGKDENTRPKNLTPFSILDYQDDVTEEEGKGVKDLVNYLEQCLAMLPDAKIINDNEDMCPICYAFPIEVTFEPCGHQTCRTCIDRQLLNKRECFFCKGTIERVVDLSGNIIHQFSGEVSDDVSPVS